MGNNIFCGECHQTPKEHPQILSMLNMSKRRKTVESFFIQHIKDNDRTKAENVEVRTVMDQRRIVFVCVQGLYESWRNVPSVLMYTSLCLMRLKRKWIMEPTKYSEQLQSILPIPSTRQNHRGFLQFVELLKWKDSQGLVVWISDYFDDYGTPIELDDISSVDNVLVASFWHGLNDKLTNLYDHITETHYNPINLDENWWGNKHRYVSKYGVKASYVLTEFFFVKWRFKVIKEIIYQSNPKTLHAVTVYNQKSNFFVNTQPKQTRQPRKCDENCLETPLSPIKERRSVEVDHKEHEYQNSYSWCANHIGDVTKITE